MSLSTANLRKLLTLFHADPSKRQASIRADIRGDLANDLGGNSGGGDFYVPFWADVKAHVYGQTDLLRTVDERIEVNNRRENLYPQLAGGFLAWWNQYRRGSNEPFQPLDSLRGSLAIIELGASIKVENFLSFRDGAGSERHVYPYFSPAPELSNASARLGLWAIGGAIPDVPLDNVIILDVIRGEGYSVRNASLHGDERDVFVSRYRELLLDRERLSPS